MTRKKVIAVCVLCTLLLLFLFLLLRPSKCPYAHVKGVGVSIYSDKECKHTIHVICFGKVEQGVAYFYKIYVRNDGDFCVKLRFKTENWNPKEASYYVFCFWNIENYTLKPKEVKDANITLYVYPLIRKFPYAGEFNFDIVIVGETQNEDCCLHC